MAADILLFMQVSPNIRLISTARPYDLHQRAENLCHAV
jgi:hypothetical protein